MVGGGAIGAPNEPRGRVGRGPRQKGAGRMNRPTLDGVALEGAPSGPLEPARAGSTQPSPTGRPFSRPRPCPRPCLAELHAGGLCAALVAGATQSDIWLPTRPDGTRADRPQIGSDRASRSSEQFRGPIWAISFGRQVAK